MFYFWQTYSRDKVLTLLRALQGHTESGRLWQSLINQILKRMGFTTTTHDRNMYLDIYKYTGDTIYLLIKVDDFALACSNESFTNDIYDQIGDALQLPGE